MRFFIMKQRRMVVSHFMNSAFIKPGTYSCAVDCFLEIFTHLFLPFLSKLLEVNFQGYCLVLCHITVNAMEIRNFVQRFVTSVAVPHRTMHFISVERLQCIFQSTI